MRDPSGPARPRLGGVIICSASAASHPFTPAPQTMTPPGARSAGTPRVARIPDTHDPHRIDRRDRDRKIVLPPPVRRAGCARDRRGSSRARRGGAWNSGPHGGGRPVRRRRHRRGSLDRGALGRIVFADTRARAALEAIVHPEVYRRIREWSANQPAGTRVAIADIPLVYETGQEHEFDRVVVAACAPEEQLRRIAARDG